MKQLSIILISGILTACIPSRPITIPVASVGTVPDDVKVLQENVTATDCPDFGYMYGNFNDAIAMAIEQVPGANALINVKFEQKDNIGRYCMRVTGDAVAL